MEWLRNLKLRRQERIIEKAASLVLDGKNEPFRHLEGCRRPARPCGCTASFVNEHGTTREVFLNAFPNRAIRRRLARQALGRKVSK